MFGVWGLVLEFFSVCESYNFFKIFLGLSYGFECIISITTFAPLRALREILFTIPFFRFFHSLRFQPWVDEIARLETGNSYKHRLETGANSGTKCQPFELIEQIEPFEPCSSHRLETGAKSGTKCQPFELIEQIEPFEPPNLSNFTNLLNLLNPYGYTATLKSLNASFKLVFKSVLALRFPIINAQLT